jgi:glucan phosphoethanolaminetransferase (alkaline phosphatase superfamily)
MAMLETNRTRVKNLTGLEIWLFIIGRVLVAFGLGVLAMIYFPSIASGFAWPSILVGMGVLVVAARGMFKKGTQRPAA